MNKNVFKSIGAVVSGFVSIIILSIAADFLFEKLGVFPHQELFAAWMLGIALAYRSVFTVVGDTLLLVLHRKIQCVTCMF